MKLKALLYTLLGILGVSAAAIGATGLPYPGGLTTQSVSGCVRYNRENNPPQMESTGVACNTANAIQEKTFATLGTPANGTVYYCNNCNQVTPCTGSAGIGAIAERINGVWQCSSGGLTSVNFNDIGSGTNPTATMTVGTGGSIVPSGSGVITATDGDSATAFFSVGTIEAARLPDADDDATTKGVATFNNTQFDATSGSVTIATGGIGATELASTAVTPGSYTSANITVDADGRVTAAANGSGSGGVVTGIAGDSGGTTTGATVTLAGGDGVTTTRSGDTVTVDVDSTVARRDSANTFTSTSGKQVWHNSSGVSGFEWDPAAAGGFGELAPTNGFISANNLACGGPCVDISTETNLTASGGITLTGDNLTADLGTSIDISSETNLTGGTGITLTGDDLSFTPAEMTDFTWSNGTAATSSQSTNLSGSNDPDWQARDMGYTISSTGSPSISIDDTDIAPAGSGRDFDVSVSCVGGATCTVTITQANAGAVSNVLTSVAGGALTLGASGTTAITLVTNGTGDSEVVLPVNSIQLAGGAGVSEVTGTLPTGNGGTGNTTGNASIAVKEGNSTVFSAAATLDFLSAHFDITGSGTEAEISLDANVVLVGGASILPGQLPTILGLDGVSKCFGTDNDLCGFYDTTMNIMELTGVPINVGPTATPSATPTLTPFPTPTITATGAMTAIPTATIQVTATATAGTPTPIATSAPLLQVRNKDVRACRNYCMYASHVNSLLYYSASGGGALVAGIRDWVRSPTPYSGYFTNMVCMNGEKDVQTGGRIETTVETASCGAAATDGAAPTCTWTIQMRSDIIGTKNTQETLSFGSPFRSPVFAANTPWQWGDRDVNTSGSHTCCVDYCPEP